MLFFYFLFYFIFKLYIIVLVLPNIKMNPPQVYMCSPSWTLLPPPSPFHPYGSSQCTSPKHPVSCIEPGLATRFIHDILHVSMPFSQTTGCVLRMKFRDFGNVLRPHDDTAGLELGTARCPVSTVASCSSPSSVDHCPSASPRTPGSPKTPSLDCSRPLHSPTLTSEVTLSRWVERENAKLMHFINITPGAPACVKSVWSATSHYQITGLILGLPHRSWYDLNAQVSHPPVCSIISSFMFKKEKIKHNKKDRGDMTSMKMFGGF